MRRTLNNIISVLFTFVKFVAIKVFHWRRFRFSVVERFSPNVVTEINHGGSFFLGKKVRVHGGTKIKVRSGGELIIGDNVKINYNSIIVCRNNISIGEGTEFGPSVYLYDHDHDYRIGLKENKYKCAPISIGKNCWIGANTVILRGTTIGDNCVVGAGCIVKGMFAPNSIIVQKRETTIKQIDG